ncbi:MAG: hypothetical protein K2X29_00370, partial [Candidatus Obscuribacterales bacterium]|nr:hypothetical protein [Candidatus Obscuribacterales bacterium]
KLVERGMSREDAYKIVQGNAMQAWNTKNGSFKDNLMNDKNVTGLLSAKEIEETFDPKHYLRNIDQVFERLGI